MNKKSKKSAKPTRSRKPRLEDEPAFQKLVSDISKLIEEAQIKGVDFNREHFLNCFSCGCFEGMTPKGSRCLYREDCSPADLDADFTVLDVRRRQFFLKNGTLRWRTTYHYICGLCGAEQRVCHVDEFSKPHS